MDARKKDGETSENAGRRRTWTPCTRKSDGIGAGGGLMDAASSRHPEGWTGEGGGAGQEGREGGRWGGSGEKGRGAGEAKREGN